LDIFRFESFESQNRPSAGGSIWPFLQEERSEKGEAQFGHIWQSLNFAREPQRSTFHLNVIHMNAKWIGCGRPEKILRSWAVRPLMIVTIIGWWSGQMSLLIELPEG
jgi:hypothetical protein